VILSAGLTPAWQQILVFDCFRWGNVNRASEAVWCASGKVLNAGIAAHTLGGPSLTLAAVGGMPLNLIDREMADLGVPHRWIETESATRVCTTIIDRATDTITELAENGRPITPRELEAFIAAYAEEAARADIAVLIGSLPVGVPVATYRELLSRTPCPAVLDFRGDGLLGVLDLRPLVVKPNRDELAQTTGGQLDDDAKLVDAMRELNRRGAAWVVVTDGAKPVWLTSARKVYRLHPPAVSAVVNPIGSGDSAAAAIAWSLRAGCDVVAAVRFGIGAACENLKSLLPCRLDPIEVEQSASQVRVEEIE